MSISTIRVCPVFAANISAVHLHTRSVRIHKGFKTGLKGRGPKDSAFDVGTQVRTSPRRAARSFGAALPAANLGSDVGVGIDEQINQVRVAASNRRHQCSPPAAHSARIGRRAAVASGVLPIVVRGGDVGAGSNEQLNHVLVAGACRLDERSLPAALWLRSDGSRCLARTRRLSMVASGTRHTRLCPSRQGRCRRR